MQCSVAQTLSGRQGAQSPCFRGPAALVAGGPAAVQVHSGAGGFSAARQMCVSPQRGGIESAARDKPPALWQPRENILSRGVAAGVLQQGGCSRGAYNQRGSCIAA